jgi:predicted nucleic acid-binding protein
MSDKVFFDTNVLVYAHDATAPEKCARSRELLFASIEAGNGVISAQVLSEFFVTVTQKVRKPIAPERARRELQLLSTLPTVDIDSTLVLQAAERCRTWLVSFWDALILAAAARGGCATVYSEDLSDGRLYGSVTVRNPFVAKRSTTRTS